MRVESKADAAPVLHNDPRYCFLPERESVTCASLVPPKKLKIVLKRTNYIFLTRLQSLQTLKTQYFGTQKVRTSICTMRGCMESLMQDFNAMHFVHERPKSTTIPHELAKDHAN